VSGDVPLPFEFINADDLRKEGEEEEDDDGNKEKKKKKEPKLASVVTLAMSEPHLFKSKVGPEPQNQEASTVKSDTSTV
jgi:hypothetical protein